MRTKKKKSRTGTGGRPQKRREDVWVELARRVLRNVSCRYPELKKEVVQKIETLERVSKLGVHDKINPEDFNVLVELSEAMNPMDFEVLGKTTKEALLKLVIRVEMTLLLNPVDSISTRKRRRRKSIRPNLLAWLYLNHLFCVKRAGREIRVASPCSRIFAVSATGDVIGSSKAGIKLRRGKPERIPTATLCETAIAASEALGIDVRESDLNGLH